MDSITSPICLPPSCSFSAVAANGDTNAAIYNTYSLEQMKELIEKMNKHHQIEILKIIYKDPSSITINENKNGIYINLAYLPANVIEDICKYIQYTEQQETSLNVLEVQKNKFKNTFF